MIKMRHLDLFSGIGGFALAAKWAGIETIGFCEKDEFCQQVLAKHWPDVIIYPDIKILDGHQVKHQVDLLTAGFPCQPFSVAGKQKGRDDDRYLWPDTMRIIRECRPTWIILENVPGIIPHLDPILEDLEREGYEWQAYLITASAVGAPHKRERLWIIAHRDSNGLDCGISNRQERHLQDDWQRHIEAIHAEWPQFFPQSWSTFNTQEWLGFITNATSERQQGEGSFGESLHSAQDTEGQTSDAINDINNAKFTSDTDSKPESQNNSRIESTETPRPRYSRADRNNQPDFNWQEDQPPIPGVDDGLPNGLDRNKALGNAIVPQIPYLLMKIIQFI